MTCVKAAKVRVRVLCYQLSDAMFVLTFLKAFLWLTHVDRDLSRVLAATFANRYQQPQQVVAKRREYPRDHAEVQQSNTTVVRQKNVSGVWICMHQPVK